ncbi:MAG: protein tyrosine phosphatase (PTP) superfamily phosphohydrolase (DUF442 family) [Oceanicoccus sp.]|jgi:protein tyrosine phosphatase (PTP) superfamily phosphohydrolase (DUF442 family)
MKKLKLDGVITMPFITIFMIFFGLTAHALEDVDPTLDEITNFRQYSPSFSSAGQPTVAQFQRLKASGFERIIYIAFTNSGKNAIPEEDIIVKSLGMEYLQIPVDFQTPLPSEFYVFADALRRFPDKVTLLHCQVNARASVFSFLYRVIYGGVSMAIAKDDLNTVWRPNEQWRNFVFTVLKENDLSPDCEGCQWNL